MTIALTDDHRALADTVRSWARHRFGPADRRRALDEAEQADGRLTPLPEQWREMAELGWLGLALPEDMGGEGFGLAEAAVVLEELGRVLVPGPAVTTILAGLLVDELGADAQRHTHLAGLADGSMPTSVAIGLDPMIATPDGADRRLTGPIGPVPWSMGVRTVLLPIEHGTTAGWAVLDADGLLLTTHPGLDLLRPMVTLDLDEVTVEPDRFLPDPDGRGAALAALVLSTEALGVGAWCVDTASAHARDRIQFGRPIGQFQAVKHRCADMLATLELARAAVWDAARGGPADEHGFAVAAAAALAPEAAATLAKDCIQVLGGIGFTWEHDAHLYLRRAVASRALLPASVHWQEVLTDLARDGVRRELPVDLPAEADGHRDEVRAWLDRLGERPKSEWDHAVVEAGYLAPHWPAPWGRDAAPVEQLVIDQEFRAARVRRPHLQVAAWALPTLVAHGTAEQQERWMGPSMRFDVAWCQLFSEPEAGSDLAALRTSAERVDGGWLLTGQKVWTSMAAEADWGICLARTDPDAPEHEGITCFFVDMTSEGIDIRPLRELTGAAWFNEVFLDQVFVPDDCVIGAVNDGWRAGRTTLANERVAMGGGSSIGAGVTAAVTQLADDASAHDRAEVGALLATDHALSALRTRMTLRAVGGAEAGAESSVAKLLGVIHDQRVQEVGLGLLGPAGAAADGDAAGWAQAFLWNRCLTIAGGTSEIQRNVIAERLLGLPRDP